MYIPTCAIFAIIFLFIQLHRKQQNAAYSLHKDVIVISGVVIYSV